MRIATVGLRFFVSSSAERFAEMIFVFFPIQRRGTKRESREAGRERAPVKAASRAELTRRLRVPRGRKGDRERTGALRAVR
jgi:hypothetical protein